MDPLLAVIFVLGAALLAASVYMEWLGLLSVASSHSSPRHALCGHRKLTPGNDRELCWHCRHRHLDEALHALHH
ncbi:MAG TPA: hypothetical protein VG899_07790 [Mycobacteriales bacterium]|nr:hypothetical protein [Mycobacteriales bacterium]HWA66255.1 hypothetical protein [Mycobacteriales bacterium]